MRTNSHIAVAFHKTCQMAKCIFNSKISPKIIISLSTHRTYNLTDKTRHRHSIPRCSQTNRTSLHHRKNRCKSISLFHHNRNIKVIRTSNFKRRNMTRMNFKTRKSAVSKDSRPSSRLWTPEKKCWEDGRKVCRQMFHRWTLKIFSKA